VLVCVAQNRQLRPLLLFSLGNDLFYRVMGVLHVQRVAAVPQFWMRYSSTTDRGVLQQYDRSWCVAAVRQILMRYSSTTGGP